MSVLIKCLNSSRGSPLSLGLLGYVTLDTAMTVLTPGGQILTMQGIRKRNAAGSLHFFF